MKQTQLKRKTPLKANSQLRRSKLNQSGRFTSYPKRSSTARAKDFSKSVRQTVMERSNGMCELCGMRRIAHIHHCTYRSQGGTGELSNALGVCIPCHEACHSTRAMRDHAVIVAMELAEGVEEVAATVRRD